MMERWRRGHVVGWTPKEVIWLKAALTLPAFEFLMACEDISSMSGRPISAVAAKAKALQPVYTVRRAQPSKAVKGTPAATPEPFVLRQLTKAELMVGRAR